jgi:hypothetical protein
MFSSFCFQRKLRIQNPVYIYIQKEENIGVPVHVYWVLYSQYSLEIERRKHRCTCILGSVFSECSGNREYMYIYVFFFLFPENTEKTKPSIHVQLCFLLLVSREY